MAIHWFPLVRGANRIVVLAGETSGRKGDGETAHPGESRGTSGRNVLKEGDIREKAEEGPVERRAKQATVRENAGETYLFVKSIAPNVGETKEPVLNVGMRTLRQPVAHCCFRGIRTLAWAGASRGVP